MWLPIDCQVSARGLRAPARGAASAPIATACEAAARRIELRVCAARPRTIREKYVAPPHTTDFAILFLPTEGLYAEALRRPGLMDALQRDYRVTLAGPDHLARHC